MAENTTYHRFRLNFNSPWNLGTLTNHNWSCKFAVSGSIAMGLSDAEATAIALAKPILDCASPKTYMLQWSYYPSGTTVASSTKTYGSTDHPGTKAAYSASPNVPQQLEVAIVAHCPVGTNTRGKEVYLRHYLHDVFADSANSNAPGGMTSAAATLAPWNSGAGPHAVVPVSPSTGQQGGPWTFESHLFTHQLRKGKRRKVAKAQTTADLLSLLQRVASGSLSIDALKLLLAGL